MKHIILTLLVVLILNSVNATIYTRRTYLYYQQYNPPAEQTDFHAIEIIYSASDNISTKSDASSDWKYSIKTSTTGSTVTVINSAVYQNNPVNSRYAAYLLNTDGTHFSKHYVAWTDDEKICDSATDQTKVLYKIKFFTCEVAAKNFYDKMNPDSSTLNILAATSTGTVIAEDKNSDTLFLKTLLNLDSTTIGQCT